MSTDLRAQDSADGPRNGSNNFEMTLKGGQLEGAKVGGIPSTSDANFCSLSVELPPTPPPSSSTVAPQIHSTEAPRDEKNIENTAVEDDPLSWSNRRKVSPSTLKHLLHIT